MWTEIIAGKKIMTTVNPASTKKLEPAKKPDFEYSLARLEEIVGKLESANLSLDEAMKLFEEGVQLSRDCQKYLGQAEGKVEILLEEGAGGEGDGGGSLRSRRRGRFLNRRECHGALASHSIR